MIRVKDAQKSLKFYQDVLGMSLVRTHEAASAGFNLYFLAYPSAQPLPTEGNTAQREGLLELTWNYGTEKDESFKYHSGNEEPQGFGHICECGLRWRARSTCIYGSILTDWRRHQRGRAGRGVQAVRRPQGQLAEAAHGRAHEERGIPSRPGWILGRGGAEPGPQRQVQRGVTARWQLGMPGHVCSLLRALAQ